MNGIVPILDSPNFELERKCIFFNNYFFLFTSSASSRFFFQGNKAEGEIKQEELDEVKSVYI